MKIHNREQHFNCYSYEKGETPVIENKNLRSMQTGERALPLCNEIIFLIEGKLLFFWPDNTTKDLGKGQFILLPASDKCQYKALTKSKLLIVRLKDGIHLCNSFSLEKLYKIADDEEEKPDNLVALPMNSRLRGFVQEMASTMEDGLKCRTYLEAQMTSLFIMIRSYYSPEQLYQFFYPILSSNVFFSEQVRIHYRNCKTANDLAKTMGMTAQQFTRRFNSVFGQAPYEWMQQEKAKLIYSEICKGDKSFGEIAKRHGFTVQGNFNRFCRTAFAMSPGDIRRQRL